MPDESNRIELAEHFRQQYGPDLAAYLMEVIPPFSWSEIVTKSDLRAELGGLEGRLNERIDRLDQRVDGVDGQIDRLEDRIDRLEDRLTERIDLRSESVADKLRGEYQKQMNRMLRWLLPVIVAAIAGTSALS